MIGRVFISYRRGADSHIAGRLFESLADYVPRKQLFMDVDSIPPGTDYVKFLEEQIKMHSIMLVIIGEGWLSSVTRLSDSSDFVHIEIACALRGNKIVIPILFDSAALPRDDIIPEDMRPLLRRQGFHVRHATFKADIFHLAKRIRTLVAESKKNISRKSDRAGVTSDAKSHSAIISSMLEKPAAIFVQITGFDVVLLLSMLVTVIALSFYVIGLT